MNLESCSVPSSFTSSSSPAAEIAENRMVEMELEAAEALADLAHLAMRESGVAETATNWGCKGKRVRKRAKSDSQSPPGHSGLNLTPIDPVPLCDPADDRAVLDQQQDGTMCSDVILKPVKAEQDADLSSMCAPRYTLIGGRSRQNLTEDEKEARRIRRILANRESARQTIRRRQALCEELSRKAADLARENESLKREKELAFKEYESLETINKQLKALMAKAIKPEVGESSRKLKSANSQISISPANCPLLLYNHHPFSPLGWPSIIQNLHPLQSGHGPLNPVTIPSNIPAPAADKDDSYQDQENLTKINTTRTPFYIVPCPWFVPLPDNGNGSHTQLSGSLKNILDETSRHDGYDPSSSSQSITNMENILSHRKATNEASVVSSEARTTSELNDFQVEFPPNGGSLHAGSCSREATFTQAQLCSVGGSNIVNAWPKKKQEATNYPSKKLVDTVAAAEARKRRKELTKLKNLHGRQCRTQG